MHYRNDRYCRELVTIVVSGNRRVVPVRDLVRENLCKSRTRQPQILDLLAGYEELVRECGSTGHDRQVGELPAARSCRNSVDEIGRILARRIGITRHLVRSLVADVRNSEVGRAVRKVLTTCRRARRSKDDLEPAGGNICNPLINRVRTPTRTGTSDLLVRDGQWLERRALPGHSRGGGNSHEPQAQSCG